MKIHVLTLLCLSLFTVRGFSQNIETSRLGWRVDQLTDLVSSESAAYSCSFIIDGKTDIRWKQNGRADMLFRVVSSSGHWADTSQNGKMTYTVSYEGEEGTLAFERSSSGTFIVLQLEQSSGGQLKHRYRVAEVIINPSL